MADYTLPFTLITFPPSGAADALLRGRLDDLEAFHVGGIPGAFVTARFRAQSTLSVAADEVGHRLVKFGTTVLGGSMCLDPATGEIVQLVGRKASRFFVNTTLATYTTTVREVSNAFPFYSDNASVEEIEAAAQRASEVIRSIDREALVPDRYWSTFVDDMRTGA